MMHGIWWAALVVSLFGAVGAAVLWWSAGRRWIVLLPVLMALPLSPLVNFFVKRPLYLGLQSLTGVPLASISALPWWFLLLVHPIPPLTEEAVKLLPLAVPGIRALLVPGMRGGRGEAGGGRAATAGRSGLVHLALAIGLGFGLGEAWWIAWGVARAGLHAGLPVYYFGGFINERLVVMFCHGAMTAVALRGISRALRYAEASLHGRRVGAVAAVLGGYAGAVLLHALLNVGAVLYQIGKLGPMGANLTLVASALLLVLVLERIYREGLRGQRPREQVLWQGPGPRTEF
ncbi:MAG: hypothetical protein AB1446_09930 [Bacillota bacterium]